MEKELFIKKFHTTKTYKFDPPTWEDFLKTKTHDDMFAHWFCGDIYIVMCEKNNEKGILKTHNQFEVSLFNDYDSEGRNFGYCNEYGIDTREETYYKALEYARELFIRSE